MYNTKPEITVCRSEQALLTFLGKVDKTLPVPLSDRVDLVEFARNNLARGYVYAIEANGEIVCAAIFYYHFLTETAAYLDLLATVPGYGGRGYASQVMDAIEAAAKQADMTEQTKLHFLYMGSVDTKLLKPSPKSKCGNTYKKNSIQKDGAFLCLRYLSSRAVARQVLSAYMSLTSVFGMGTGGPS